MTAKPVRPAGAASSRVCWPPRADWSSRSSSEADAITLGCLVENVGQELRELDARLIEHSVTAMPFSGPAVFLATAARTVVADPQAAADYLERLRRSGDWIDQQTERLRIGAGRGRLPVAPLVQQAIEWAENLAPIGGSRGARRPPTAGGLGRERRRGARSVTRWPARW